MQIADKTGSCNLNHTALNDNFRPILSTVSYSRA